jgi:hypothetical protein
MHMEDVLPKRIAIVRQRQSDERDRRLPDEAEIGGDEDSLDGRMRRRPTRHERDVESQPVIGAASQGSAYRSPVATAILRDDGDDGEERERADQQERLGDATVSASVSARERPEIAPEQGHAENLKGRDAFREPILSPRDRVEKSGNRRQEGRGLAAPEIAIRSG